MGAYYYTGTDLRVEGFRQQLDYLVTHGFRVVHKRSKELPGGGYKGNLDIEMSLDMLDFVGFYDKAFALTGDGDFIPVFSRLRDRGVQVLVGNFGVGSDASLKLVADGSLNLGLLLSLVIEQEKRRTEQSRFDQPELPLGETLDTHVDRNMLAGRLYSLGRNAYDRDELSQALNHFSQSVSLMPRQVRYHHWLALTLAALGRYADAANELEDLVRQEVEDAEVLYDLGQVYEKLGAQDKALEAYARCSSLDSRYKDVQNRKQELERLVKSSNGQATGQRGRGTRSRQSAPARSRLVLRQAQHERNPRLPRHERNLLRRRHERNPRLRRHERNQLRRRHERNPRLRRYERNQLRRLHERNPRLRRHERNHLRRRHGRNLRLRRRYERNPKLRQREQNLREKALPLRVKAVHGNNRSLRRARAWRQKDLRRLRQLPLQRRREWR